MSFGGLQNLLRVVGEDEAEKFHQASAIYGEASADEAKELYDEGVDFYPLPTLPDDKN